MQIVLAAFLQVLQQTHSIQQGKMDLICQNSAECESIERTSASSVYFGLEALARVATSEGSHKLRSILVKNNVPQTKCAQRPDLAAISNSESRQRGGLFYEPRVLRCSGLMNERVVEADAHCLNGEAATITGGLGGLGLLTACFIHGMGAVNIKLLGRSGHGKIPPSLISSGTLLSIQRCDVGSRDECLESASSQARGGRLKRIIHAGGVLKDALLADQTANSLREVLAPKVHGLRNLLTSLRGYGAQFQAFSSIAGVLGSSGQGSYAAANSMMDAIVVHATSQVNSSRSCESLTLCSM